MGSVLVVLSREVLWVWWPHEQAEGTGLLDFHHSPPLLTCGTFLSSQHPAATVPLPPFCAPFSVGQEGFWLQQFWGQIWTVHSSAAVVGTKIWGFLGHGWSSVSVQLALVSLGWRWSHCSAHPHRGQCFPLCRLVSRAPACQERCLVSQAWISTSRRASGGRGHR